MIIEDRYLVEKKKKQIHIDMWLKSGLDMFGFFWQNT